MPETETMTPSPKRPWSAPHIIESVAAVEAQNTVPFPGIDHYEAYFPSAGS